MKADVLFYRNEKLFLSFFFNLWIEISRIGFVSTCLVLLNIRKETRVFDSFNLFNGKQESSLRRKNGVKMA